MNTIAIEENAVTAAPEDPLSSAQPLYSRRPPADSNLNGSKTSTHTARSAASPALPGAVTGTLIGFEDNGRVPLVLFQGQPGSAAVAAASTVDVSGPHIGHRVVLIFERGDPGRPIIVGLLHGERAWPLEQTPGQVQIDADGKRLIITAHEQLVMRCGNASITLTKAGKVLIQGDYVSTTSSGVMRITGGSVQMN